MKTYASVAFAVSILMAATSLCSFAQTKKQVTLNGDLVDVVAFVTSPAKQDTAALTKGAKAGNALGLYDTKSKKLYILGVPEIGGSANERVLPYVGARVFVTGKVYNKAGLNVILISDVGRSIK
jgi:hypothetical protein